MATEPLPDLPEGFEALSRADQIEYIQALWERVRKSDNEVPVPDWHLELLEQRLESRDPDDDSDWNTVKERLEGQTRD